MNESRGASRDPARGDDRDSSAPNWRSVGVAVIRDGSRVLVTRRGAEEHLGGCDEFPGGLVEPGESAEACCLREVKEEVGLDVRVVKVLTTARHEDGERRLALTFFECACVGSSALTPKVVVERSARWVEARELATLRFPPANRELVRRLAAGQA